MLFLGLLCVYLLALAESFEHRVPYRHYIVAGWGGVRSKMVVAWLKNNTRAKVSHIHDRFPPKELTQVRNLRFTRLKMSEEQRKQTHVLFVIRDIGESISSRLSYSHCKHLQGSNCDIFTNIRERNVVKYIHRGQDDLKLREHWDAYTQKEHSYPVTIFYSIDLWNASRFQCILKKLSLPSNVKPPVFWETGDRYSRPRNATEIALLQNMYKDLQEKLDERAECRSLSEMDEL